MDRIWQWLGFGSAKYSSADVHRRGRSFVAVLYFRAVSHRPRRAVHKMQRGGRAITVVGGRLGIGINTGLVIAGTIAAQADSSSP
jgi:hypothetical protein